MTDPERRPPARHAGSRTIRRTPRMAPYEAWSKPALYARARKLVIEGRSSMRKGDLVFALYCR